MVSLLWLPVALQVLAPILMLALLAMGRERSDAAWVLAAVSVGLYLAAVAKAGMWLLLPWYTPILYGLTFIAALVFSLRRAGTRGFWPGAWLAGIKSANCSLLVLHPEKAVENFPSGKSGEESLEDAASPA